MPNRPPPLEGIFESFDLLKLSRSRDRQKLRELILGQYPITAAPYSILDYILSTESNNNIPVCQSVIVENRYIDKDHSAAFSSFYARSFRNISKECKRLHFFTEKIIEDDVLNLEDKVNSYAGFCILRPLPFRRIGRTALKRMRFQQNLEFPTCHGNIDVNLAGSKLVVDAPVYMEQDTMVSACASVAIWISTTTMARRFNTTECTTSDITGRATQYLLQNRPMPSEGLHYEQMIHALRAMDYDPVLHGVIKQLEAKHTIYTYVESEIPPILVCELADGGDHAIVAVGHRYYLPINQPVLTKVKYLDGSQIKFARSSEWTSSFLINDDQRGLYRTMKFIDSDTRLLTQRVRSSYPDIDIDDFKQRVRSWKCPIAIDMEMPAAQYTEKETIANIWAIIVPLPIGVILQGEQAEIKSARLLRYWHSVNNIPVPDDLVLRTYLIPSNEYKQRIEVSNIHPFVKALYRGKPMPKWIWITEISSKDSYNSVEPERWLIRGEVILDATSSPWTTDFISFHYVKENDSIIATMKPEHIDEWQALSRFWLIDGDKQYPGWIR